MKFLEAKIRGLGTAACPPYHLAIVIGGTSAEYALKTAKLASARYLDTLPVEGNALGRGFRDVKLEADVLALAQRTGIGAQFGGKYFCHDVRVIRLPRHGASCPVAIAVSCSADRQALAIVPESADALIGLATALADGGNPEEAERTFKLAIAAQPRYSAPHTEYGILMLRLGRPGDAITPFQRVAELEPDNAGTFNNLGVAYLNAGDFDQAAEAFSRSLAIEPRRSSYSNIGVGYYYTSLQTTRLSGIVGIQDEAQGFEAYYNVAITPAASLTIDVQVVEPSTSNVDTGVLLAMRLGLRF
jgi:tetratricopeptide (TPR) repeat protein